MRNLLGPVSVLVLALALLASATPVSANHQGPLLGAILRGSREVPGPGDPDGSGSALIHLQTLPTSQVCFAIRVRNIVLPATGAHIHVGPAGVAGDIVVGLAAPDASGSSSGCVEASREIVRAIREDPAGYYVNVHTTDFPAGAIRGQLFPVSRAGE